MTEPAHTELSPPPRAVLVTGAGVRIGRAIALALAGRGWAVAVHYRNSAEAAEAVAAEIAAGGGRAATVRGDLAREAETEALMPAAAAALGPIGLLVNNASVFERDTPETATRDSWNRHLESNLRAPFVLTQALVRQLPEGHAGLVVNILDERVWSLTGDFTSYTVSKAGLWALTRQLALGLAPRVRVNGVGPGPVLPSTHQTDHMFERQWRSMPLGRGATPEEIAAAVVFLTEAPAVTGQMIAVDGGQHLCFSPRPRDAPPDE